MKSSEVKIAEAVASLRTRLDGWGVEDSQEKAHAYVTDMLRHGWRPAAPATIQPPATTERTEPGELYRLARAALSTTTNPSATERENEEHQ